VGRLKVELTGNFRAFKNLSTRIKREWGRIQRKGDGHTYSTKPGSYPAPDVRAVYYMTRMMRYRGGYAEFRRMRGHNNLTRNFILTGRLYRNIKFQSRFTNSRLIVDVVVNNIPYYGKRKNVTTSKVFDIWFVKGGPFSFGKQILREIPWEKLMTPKSKFIRAVLRKT